MDYGTVSLVLGGTVKQPTRMLSKRSKQRNPGMPKNGTTTFRSDYHTFSLFGAIVCDGLQQPPISINCCYETGFGRLEGK